MWNGFIIIYFPGSGKGCSFIPRFFRPKTLLVITEASAIYHTAGRPNMCYYSGPNIQSDRLPHYLQ